ncbi:MAG: helix-turn-helix transcriptional regulator [Rikenella sp.]|nr:helix-turn-helix transcriptional regulator [Rikenella sp.]
MGLLTSETPLSTAFEQHPSLIPLVSRFGIRLGVGEKTVSAVCAEHGIDAGFMLVLMNTYLFESYFPEQRLKTFHVNQIVDYLTKTNAYFRFSQLPNIERHLRSLIASGEGENKNLDLIGRFFEQFKASLTASIEYDTNEWFPYCLALSRGEGVACEQPPKSLHAPSEGEEFAASQLCDLRSILVRHLSGQYDDNLAYAVIFAIGSIERDIRQHNRIRNRILTPIIDALLCPESH